MPDLFYDIIHEGSLYKARFQEDKSRLISSTSAPSVNNVVFVFFFLLLPLCGFLRIARSCISTDFAIYCDCNLI